MRLFVITFFTKPDPTCVRILAKDMQDAEAYARSYCSEKFTIEEEEL